MSLISLLWPPPTSTLFPYTTLFRSDLPAGELRQAVDQPARGLGSDPPEHDRGLVLGGWIRGTGLAGERKSTRLSSSHRCTAVALFCLIKKSNRSTTGLVGTVGELKL